MNLKEEKARETGSDTEAGQTEPEKNTGRVLEDLGTAVPFAESNLPEKAREYLAKYLVALGEWTARVSEGE